MTDMQAFQIELQKNIHIAIKIITRKMMKCYAISYLFI